MAYIVQKLGRVPTISWYQKQGLISFLVSHEKEKYETMQIEREFMLLYHH